MQLTGTCPGLEVKLCLLCDFCLAREGPKSFAGYLKIVSGHQEQEIVTFTQQGFGLDLVLFDLFMTAPWFFPLEVRMYLI